eukprot:5422861-Prymnesium_polylepis.1
MVGHHASPRRCASILLEHSLRLITHPPHLSFCPARRRRRRSAASHMSTLDDASNVSGDSFSTVGPSQVSAPRLAMARDLGKSLQPHIQERASFSMPLDTQQRASDDVHDAVVVPLADLISPDDS